MSVCATFGGFWRTAPFLSLEERLRGRARSTPRLRLNPTGLGTNSPGSPVDGSDLLTAPSNVRPLSTISRNHRFRFWIRSRQCRRRDHWSEVPEAPAIKRLGALVQEGDETHRKPTETWFGIDLARGRSRFAHGLTFPRGDKKSRQRAGAATPTIGGRFRRASLAHTR